MNILIFTLATIINVTLSTIRALCTVKAGKWLSSITNAVCYGFYPLIVMLTAKGTVNIIINMLITGLVNLVCVWCIKYVEEKARKDKLWKIELAIPTNDVLISFKNNLKSFNIPYNYVEVGKWTMFNCYCSTQEQTAELVKLGKMYNGKISAYESKIS